MEDKTKEWKSCIMEGTTSINGKMEVITITHWLLEPKMFINGVRLKNE